jgi:serine/alanine adding enzyme
LHSSHIQYAAESDRAAWDAYVRKHAKGNVFHRFGWADVMRAAYGHSAYLLMLLAGEPSPRRAGSPVDPGQRVLGVLPVVHMKNPLFGNGLVSLPFLDGGGILADGREEEEALLTAAINLAEAVGARYVELRHEDALQSCAGAPSDVLRLPQWPRPLHVGTKSHKVRMVLRLPASSGLLLKSFKSKLRSQVNRALKESFTSRVGGLELLDDFYNVFLVNMRDLGSPVHSVKLMRHCLSAFREDAKIVVVYRSTEPVAAALVIGFGKVLRNPWASSLRRYASLGPNMLLYLRMLEYACDHGYELFDFGRSSPGEGTYRFKEQWGAVPEPLYWHHLSLDGRMPDPEDAAKARFEPATRCWQKLPLIVTRIIGPHIRKHISL